MEPNSVNATQSPLFRDKFTFISNKGSKSKSAVPVACDDPVCQITTMPAHCQRCHNRAPLPHPPCCPTTIKNNSITCPQPPKSKFCHEQGQHIDNSNILMQKVSSLYQNHDLSDIKITVGCKQYYAHKLILCCSSDVFRVMLTNPAWSDCQKGEITLKEEPECVQVFDDFLRYMYSGWIHLSHYNVLPVLLLADKYNVTHLRNVCIDYMCCHIVSTINHNHAVSWFQYALVGGHKKLAETCHQFILCNFHKVLSTTDYLLMDKEILLEFLRDSNLVIPDEYTLFQGVVQWLQNQMEKAENSNMEAMKDIIPQILSLIRFPMMSLPHLCQLEKESLVNDFHSFFKEKITKAMKYHSSIQQDKKDLARSQNGSSISFHPRNYTNDTWSTTLMIEDFPSLPAHDVRPLYFSTPVSGSEADENKTWEWNVDLFPKGVHYQKCIMIGLWRNVEISGSTYNTVRLALQTKLAEPREVEVVVLVMGVQDSVEYVKELVVKRCSFDKNLRVRHLNDIVPYEELNCQNSDYLTGAEGCSFKISIIIKPV